MSETKKAKGGIRARQVQSGLLVAEVAGRGVF